VRLAAFKRSCPVLIYSFIEQGSCILGCNNRGYTLHVYRVFIIYLQFFFYFPFISVLFCVVVVL